MTNEYKAAIEKHNKAVDKFAYVKADYRGRLISDDVFLAAKAEYDAATAEFDIAFSKEAELEYQRR